MKNGKEEVNILYKVKNMSDSGFTDPVDALTFETCDVGNKMPIVELKDRFLKNNAVLSSMADECLQIIKADEISEDDKGFVREFFLESMSEIEYATGRHIEYVLWLTEMDAVMDYARYCPHFFIDGYDSTAGILLNDLGTEGKLYGFEKKPKAIETIMYAKEGGIL